MSSQNLLALLILASATLSYSSTAIENFTNPAAISSTTTAATNATTKPPPETATVYYMNRTMLPQWYLEGIIWPISQYYLDYLTVLVVNGSTIIPRTFKGEPLTDYRIACPSNVDNTRNLVRSMFYKALYGYDNYEVIYYSRFSCIYCFTSLVFIIVPLFVTVLGTMVVKRLMASEKTHVYLYFNAVSKVNIVIYIATLLNGTGILRFFLIPLCYTGISVAQNFFAFSLSFGSILMDGLYGMSCLIQALLALDRFVALSFPMIYRNHITRRSTQIAIIFSYVFYTALILLGNLTTSFYQKSLCACTAASAILAQFGLSSAGFVLGFSLVTQIVCCSFVFGKMIGRKIKKARAAKKGKPCAGSSSVSAFSMLIGTCLVNVIGGIFLLGYHTCNEGILISGTACLMFYKSTIIYVCTICSSIGFYLHCVCSKPYRVTAAGIVDESLAQIFGMFGKKAPKLTAKLKNAVEPTSTSGVSSGVTMKTTGATSTDAHTRII